MVSASRGVRRGTTRRHVQVFGTAPHRFRLPYSQQQSFTGAVGRTALSCYVLQNLLAGAVCYGWGLGLAERFADARPWWIVGLWAFGGLVNVAFAVLWLRRFDRGPLELFMHRLYTPRSQVHGIRVPR
ncbi:DUF418 domain-containing protein [Amycolatopsis coloradensis]|uniref:DUF418 domain-containing protein n=1 Tax=Amycolatopsis coloradensis TaxID=76021 RepID=UPI003CC52F50